jgi:hypothetical protein
MSDKIKGYIGDCDDENMHIGAYCDEWIVQPKSSIINTIRQFYKLVGGELILKLFKYDKTEYTNIEEFKGFIMKKHNIIDINLFEKDRGLKIDMKVDNVFRGRWTLRKDCLEEDASKKIRISLKAAGIGKRRINKMQYNYMSALLPNIPDTFNEVIYLKNDGNQTYAVMSDDKHYYFYEHMAS